MAYLWPINRLLWPINRLIMAIYAYKRHIFAHKWPTNGLLMVYMAPLWPINDINGLIMGTKGIYTAY